MRALAAAAAAAALVWSLLAAASCISTARQDVSRIHLPARTSKPP